MFFGTVRSVSERPMLVTACTTRGKEGKSNECMYVYCVDRYIGQIGDRSHLENSWLALLAAGVGTLLGCRVPINGV